MHTHTYHIDVFCYRRWNPDPTMRVTWSLIPFWGVEASECAQFQTLAVFVSGMAFALAFSQPFQQIEVYEGSPLPSAVELSIHLQLNNVGYTNWLVVWNMFYLYIFWECHHPNWRTHFSAGRITTNQSQVGLHVRRGDKLRMMPGLEEATSPENVLSFLRPGVSRPKGWWWGANVNRGVINPWLLGLTLWNLLVSGCQTESVYGAMDSTFLWLTLGQSILLARLPRRKVAPDHLRNVYLATDEADTSGYHKAGPWLIVLISRWHPANQPTSYLSILCFWVWHSLSLCVNIAQSQLAFGASMASKPENMVTQRLDTACFKTWMSLSGSDGFLETRTCKRMQNKMIAVCAV